MRSFKTWLIATDSDYEIYNRYIDCRLITHIDYYECINIHDMLVHIFSLKNEEDSILFINRYINDYFEKNIDVKKDMYKYYCFISDMKVILCFFSNSNGYRKNKIMDILYNLSMQIKNVTSSYMISE